MLSESEVRAGYSSHLYFHSGFKVVIDKSGVRVLPDCKEIPVGFSNFRDISNHLCSLSDSQMRQRVQQRERSLGPPVIFSDDNY